ncbi:F-box/kelch-repeat protein At3g23880-like [Trifolium pratense]|uniref:F-box/kelch-repeat protein At3g23880-like n=1 Tax=Trifolium pratense TaxID=57577 RepID=UPI001E691A22|nr:F-box/kelch-repeat protein At3g23880-like [Trifolium pratense]
METEKTLYLPFELIIQILLRLPVKSLIRFKCVCKSWFSLISNPHFANSHFHLTTHTHRILLITPALKSLSIDFEASLSDDTAIDSRSISFLFPQSFFKLDIKGSCRGFILLHRSKNLYIWNPSTGVRKRIPLSTIDSNLNANCFYGFGYDRLRDDYLVLSMSYDPNADDMLSHLGFFSLRDKMWKEIEGTGTSTSSTTTHLPYMQSCVFPRAESLLNDTIHWLVYRYDIKCTVLVGFHLMERKLLEMPLPDDIKRGPGLYDLWVFKGFLSLWDMWGDNGKVEIWVMGKYNVQSSWSKTLVLSFDGIPTHYFCPKYCAKNGDIVGTDTCNVLVKYNSKGQLLEHRSFSNDRYGSLVALYTESLLSLPGDGDGDQA